MELLPKEKEKSLLTNQQSIAHAQVMLEISKEIAGHYPNPGAVSSH